MCVLLMAIEDTGMLPVQLCGLVVALMTEDLGAFRPIGLFPGCYRLWAKCRQDLAAEWLCANDRAYIAMGKGRSSTDCVWRAAVQSEIAATEGKYSAAIL